MKTLVFFFIIIIMLEEEVIKISHVLPRILYHNQKFISVKGFPPTPLFFFFFLLDQSYQY